MSGLAFERQEDGVGGGTLSSYDEAADLDHRRIVFQALLGPRRGLSRGADCRAGRPSGASVGECPSRRTCQAWSHSRSSRTVQPNLAGPAAAGRAGQPPQERVRHYCRRGVVTRSRSLEYGLARSSELMASTRYDVADAGGHVRIGVGGLRRCRCRPHAPARSLLAVVRGRRRSIR